MRRMLGVRAEGRGEGAIFMERTLRGCACGETRRDEGLAGQSRAEECDGRIAKRR